MRSKRRFESSFPMFGLKTTTTSVMSKFANDTITEVKQFEIFYNAKNRQGCKYIDAIINQVAMMALRSTNIIVSSHELMIIVFPKKMYVCEWKGLIDVILKVK